MKRINEDNNKLLGKMERIMAGTGTGYGTFQYAEQKGHRTLNGISRQREANRIMEDNYQLARKLGQASTKTTYSSNHSGVPSAQTLKAEFARKEQLRKNISKFPKINTGAKFK